MPIEINIVGGEGENGEASGRLPDLLVRFVQSQPGIRLNFEHQPTGLTAIPEMFQIAQAQAEQNMRLNGLDPAHPKTYPQTRNVANS